MAATIDLRERFGLHDLTGAVEVEFHHVQVAIRVWCLLQPGPVSVARAAAEFWVTYEVVVKSIEGHPSLILRGSADQPEHQTIEHVVLPGCREMRH